MEIVSYFHPNFLSLGTNGKFVKICIELVNNATPFGMFAVLINGNGKIQIQRYDYLAKGRIASNIFGRDKSRCVPMQNLISSWDTFSADEKSDIMLCITELNRSFNKFLELMNINGHGISSVDDVNQVRTYISNILNLISALSSNGNVTSGNNVFDSVKFEDNEDVVIIKEVIDTPEKSVRNMIKMAKIKNATDLTEFVVGNFYKVVKVETFDGKEYITLKNDNGEERCLLMKRVEQVDVYDNAPANDLPVDDNNVIEESAMCVQ